MALDISPALVSGLIVRQCPRWAGLAISPVASAGTDNALFRLGTDYCVRLPKAEWSMALIRKEARWLPELHNRLPLAIPELAFLGASDETFPWPWAVYHWLHGDDAIVHPPTDPLQAARDLGVFVRALHDLDPEGGPGAGAINFYRGVPLKLRDQATRQGITRITDEFDGSVLLESWDSALAIPRWSAKGVWVHGDLHAGNLLTHEGRLRAVLDFGGLGVGDPAVDLMPGWTLFSGDAREQFRIAVAADDHTWGRARGWTLSVAVVALAHYRGSNDALAHASRQAIESVLQVSGEPL